jgi:organic hydroperoxide reductase OsmC/OhrA
MSAGGQTNPEHLRQIYQAHLMLQLRVQEVGEYNQPEAIMNAARAVCFLSCLLLPVLDNCLSAFVCVCLCTDQQP